MPEAYASIVRLTRQAHPDGRVLVKRIGSFVNEVYLVEVDSAKYVAKQYTSWLSLKWLTLNLYGLGTVNFSMSGKTRMSAEYNVNKLLAGHGVKVSNIVAADFSSRVILFDYVPGDELSRILRNASKDSQPVDRDQQASHGVGKILGDAHIIDVSLGDTRPENFIIDRKGYPTLLDLEQARERKGNPAWDVAEFLYFAGHFWIFYDKVLSGIVDSFIRGYEEQGQRVVLRRAASTRYLRLFSIWTPPNILNAIRKRLLRP